MKKISILVIALVLIAACQEKVAERYTNSSPEIDQVKDLIKDYNSGNWESWVTHYADTAKLYHNVIDPSPVSDVLENLKTNLAATSSYGFVDKDMFHEMVIDDKNEKWVNFWATWEGKLEGSSEKLVIPVHLTIQFVDEKIVEEHAFYDLSKFVVQMQNIEASKMEDEETADD